MSTISDILIRALEDLGLGNFSRFKHNLRDRGQITWQRLEKATVEDTVAMLVQTYTKSNCCHVVLEILRNMNFNQMALDLEEAFGSVLSALSGGVRFDGPGFSGWTERDGYSLEDSASCSSLQPFRLNSPMHDTGAQLRIVLVGKTGAGKSSTGNTILGGSDHFHADFSPESVTATCERKIGVVCGRTVTVVDTPGLFDTTLPPDVMKREIEKCVEMSVPGPHAFLLVISLGRFTEEERNTVRWVQENFGKDASRHTIILFTGGDKLKGTIEQFVSKSAALKDLVQSCQNRYHVFNNESPRFDQSQVAALLKKIDATVRENRGKYYTNRMYQEAQRRIKEEEERQRKTMEVLQEDHVKKIWKEEREKERQNAKYEDKISSAEYCKTYFSFMKEVGTFIANKAEEKGVEDDLRTLIGSGISLMDYVVDDCEKDIEKWKKRQSELQ